MNIYIINEAIRGPWADFDRMRFETFPADDHFFRVPFPNELEAMDDDSQWAISRIRARGETPTVLVLRVGPGHRTRFPVGDGGFVELRDGQRVMGATAMLEMLRAMR